MNVTHVDVARRDSASTPASREPQEAEELPPNENRPEAQAISSHIDGRKALLELRTAHQRQQHMRKGRTVQKWMEYTDKEPQPRQGTTTQKLVVGETPGSDETPGCEDKKAARRRRGEEIRRQMARRSAARGSEHEREAPSTARGFEHEQQEISLGADVCTKAVEHWIDVTQTHVSRTNSNEAKESHPSQLNEQLQDELHEELQQQHKRQQALLPSVPAMKQHFMGTDIRKPARSEVLSAPLSCSLHVCSCAVVTGLVYSLLRHSRASV